jgi:hypothetical protein
MNTDLSILNNKIELIIEFLSNAQMEDGELNTLHCFKSHVPG